MSMDGQVTDTMISPMPEEKMVPQSKVNEVVGREKQAVEQRIRRELEERHRQEIEAMRGQSQPQGGVNVDDIVAQAEARMKENFEQQQLEQQKQEYLRHLDTVAGNYVEKMKVGPTLYEDFQETIADFDPKEFKDILFLAHEMEELPDIIYELSKNTDKLVRIDNLANKSPKMAKKEIQRLADSIRSNKAAKQSNVSTNPPIQTIKPSTAAGVHDNAKPTLKELKKASWLRG